MIFSGKIDKIYIDKLSRCLNIANEISLIHYFYHFELNINQRLPPSTIFLPLFFPFNALLVKVGFAIVVFGESVKVKGNSRDPVFATSFSLNNPNGYKIYYCNMKIKLNKI